MQNEDPYAIVILILLGALMLGVWYLSRSIGADFQETLAALIKSLFILAAGFGAWWFTRFSSPLLVSGCAILLWPVWWPVLEHVAAQGRKIDTWVSLEPTIVWWNSDWFRWGIECGLIVVFVYFLVQRMRDPYS